MELFTNINHIPPCPVISRFVAPWDTSGWYGVCPDFAEGKRLYSNSDACVTVLPEKYRGAEYIMTYDSKADGADDKQEVDFYLEQDARVMVALDRLAPDDFLPDFTDTRETLAASNGCVYRILSASYPEGSQVHIPGFFGDFHHFVVFVLPEARTGQGEPFEISWEPCTLPPYKRLAYTWYFHEVFNSLPAGSAPEGFSCGGFCRVMNYPHSFRRKYVCLKNGGFLKRKLLASGQEVLEVSIEVICGAVTAEFCGAELILKNRQVCLKNGQVLAASEDNSFDLRLVRDTCSAGSGFLNVWVNSRLASRIPCLPDKLVSISIETSPEAVAALDFISLRDNTEVFAAWEDFSVLPQNLHLSAQASAVLADYPFDTDKSLCLTGGSCCYHFPPVADTVTVETRVRAREDAFVVLPELRDCDGQLALRIAMYHSNLYASRGQGWERIFGGDTDWMYYPYDNWYNIRITASLSEGTYDLFIDGARRVCGFPLAGPVKNIAQIGYYVKKGELYIHELRVCDASSICRGLMPPNAVYDVLKAPYNAHGDGTSSDTAILQRAIDDAAYTGGTVYLHDGVFYTGSLNLHSDITFFLDRSAVLLGANSHTQYPLHTPGSSLCASRQLGRGILYGENLCNVRVTGGGFIDGQGLYGFKMNDPSDNRLPDSRPCMIYVAYSRGITLEDIHFQRSAYWTVVPLSCRNVFMQYLDLDCMNTPNRDGIDPVDCHDMTIRRCNIMAGDDGLCFKSSDPYGCENIDVSDMMIQSLASGIKFGTDTYYSLKNVSIRNCIIKNVNRCGISLESVDGAAVSHVMFDGIHMTDTGSPVYAVLGNRQRVPRGIFSIRQGSMDGICFKHLRFDRPYPFSFTKNIRENMIIGQSPQQPVRNIKFSDCHFELPGGFTEIPDVPEPIGEKYPEYDQHGLSNGYAFCLRYTEKIEFYNCNVVLEKPDVRPMVGHN